MSLSVQGGSDAFIEVIGKPLKASDTFRIDGSQVCRSFVPGKSPESERREIRIALHDLTQVSHYGGDTNGQATFWVTVGTDTEKIELRWNSGSWFFMKTNAQKEAMRMWTELSTLTARLVHPIVAIKLLTTLKAGQPVDVAGISLTADGISGRRGRGDDVFTPWPEVGNAVLTAGEVWVRGTDGKKVLYKVHRQKVNAVVLPIVVAAITDAARR